MSRSAAERAARALCRLNGYQADDPFEDNAMWHSYLPAAHAVLEALHEPSRAMVAAGKLTAKGFVDVPGLWRAMIEAADI